MELRRAVRLTTWCERVYFKSWRLVFQRLLLGVARPLQASFHCRAGSHDAMVVQDRL